GSDSAIVGQVSEAVQTWAAALRDQGSVRFAAWLTPPDLGRVWVELTRTSSGITARLRATDEGVRSVLQSQEPGLRQALVDSGLAIAELDVSGHSAGDSASQQNDQHEPPPERPSPFGSVQPPHFSQSGR